MQTGLFLRDISDDFRHKRIKK